MAGNQILTSVTILNSLHGYLALSLTEYSTSAAAAIAAGSIAEIAGAFFTFAGDEAIEASTWTSIVTGTTAYITLTASGTAGSQVVVAAYTSTAPTWRDDFQGWYASAASSVRVIGSVYKAEATNYARKYLLDSLQQDYGRNYRWRGEIERITSGAGNWTVPAGVYKIKVICVGGGGGGSGGAGAGVGGGGGTNISLVASTSINVTPGQIIPYSVGIGGSGGASSVTVGQDGTNTTFTGAAVGYGASGASLYIGGAGAIGGAGSSGGSMTAGGTAGASGGGAGGVNGSNGNYGGGGGGAGDIKHSGGNGGLGIIIIEY